MTMASEVHLKIDGIAVTVPTGTLLVEAAKQAQKHIPVYCYHEKLGPAGLCRVCLVEVEGMPKLQIGCNTVATEGMVVHTQNAKVDDGRRAILEFLLLNHPLDCPICDKGGECDLQDYVMAYGQDSSRVIDGKESKPKAVDLGPTIVLDEERCIVCQRCVRFDELITHERSLVVKDRGAHDIIATATDQPYVSQFSGNVTELCPVGALTSKTYRFLSRKWDNHRAVGSCAQCSVGCGINVDVRQGAITRTMSIPEDVTSDGWLCDRGRYVISFGDDQRRLRTPLYRHREQLVQVTWDDAIGLWAQALQASASPQRVAALGGGRLMNAEILQLQALFRSFGTPHLDWRVGRSQQAGAGRATASLAELDRAQAIIVVGVPPSQSAPVLDLAIRKAVFRHKAQLISVGPFGAGSSVPQQRAARIDEVAGLLPDGTERIVFVWDGIDPQLGREIANLRTQWSTHGRSAGVLVATTLSNAWGAEALGMHPSFGPGYQPLASSGLDTAGIFAAGRAGELDVLSFHGANPVLTWHDASIVREALARIPFVVATDLFLTQTSELATLVLPVASAFERNGTMTNLFGQARPIEAGLPVPDGALSDSEVLVALAQALKIALPDAASLTSLEERALEAARIAPLDCGAEQLAGRRLAPDRPGLQLALAANVFAGGGTTAHDTRIEALRPLPTATLEPATAQRLGFVAGTLVDLHAGAASVKNLTLRLDASLAPDTIALVADLPQAPANLLFGSEPLRLEATRVLEEVAA